MWQTRPTGARWRMATLSRAARMVLPVLTVSLTVNTSWRAVFVWSCCVLVATK